MSKTLTFEFDGIAFKQNPKAPELFSFVAPAEKLIRFCGVARKSERMLTNPLRETVTAEGPSDLRDMFEAGNPLIESMASAADSLFRATPARAFVRSLRQRT